MNYNQKNGWSSVGKIHGTSSIGGERGQEGGDDRTGNSGNKTRIFRDRKDGTRQQGSQNGRFDHRGRGGHRCGKIGKTAPHFKHIEGLMAAAFSPLDNAGKVNVSIVPEYYQFLRRNGVMGVFINGTSGEAFSLSTAERKLIVDAWVAARAGDQQDKGTSPLMLIVHVGATGISEEIELAIHARDTRVDGIASMAPLFFKPESLSHLIDHVHRVATAAKNLPYYYYHVPQVNNVDFPMLDFLNQVLDDPRAIPNLAGIKFSLPNFSDYMECQEQHGDSFDLPFCADQVLLSALPLGAIGSIGSTYNYAAPLSNKIIHMFSKGDWREARHLASCLNRLTMKMRDHGSYLSIAKAMLGFKGLNLGTVRSPLRPLGSLDEPSSVILNDIKSCIDNLGISNLMCE